MIYKSLTFLLAVQQAAAFKPMSLSSTSSRTQPLSMSNDNSASFSNNWSKVLAAIGTAAALSGPSLANAADYAPATGPPQLSPQISRQAPKAQQASTPEKWIYSKFLDQTEKDNVEKVTFSPDGKKAVGVDTEGDRFTVDIPNDPNLLSFLVQHKVEINVAPINANGGTGSEAAALVIPESDMDKLVQTFIAPGAITAGLFLYPAYKVLFPTKEEKERLKNRSRTGAGRGRGPGGLFGGGGGRGRGPGGMDPEQFAKSKAKLDLSPVTNTNFADVAGCDSAKIELEEVVDFLKNPEKYNEMGARIPRGVLLNGPPGIYVDI